MEMKGKEQISQRIAEGNCCSTLAGIVHDYNNVHTAIHGNISLAKSQISENDTLHKYLTIAEEGVQQANRLTKFLLTYAMGENTHEDKVFLTEAIKEEAELLLRDSNIEVVYYLSEKELKHKGSEEQIKLIFRNIILNAKQSIQQKGTIWISATEINLSDDNPYSLPSGEYAQLTFEDDGKGLSEEDISKIFNPGYTTKTYGHGLGLVICQSIIKKHKGHIEVSSENEKGAKFQIFFPIDED